MAAKSVHLMTVEQFRSLPEPSGEFSHELHHGCLVKITRPKKLHFSIQRKLRRLLEAAASEDAMIDTEVAFRPLAEHELWVADVAFVNGPRWSAVDAEDNLLGAPELVIEVLSPSNSTSELLEKQELCLAQGCLEFWVVDPKRQRVHVTRLDQPISIYGPGDVIPVALLREGASIPVADIFRES